MEEKLHKLVTEEILKSENDTTIDSKSSGLGNITLALDSIKKDYSEIDKYFNSLKTSISENNDTIQFADNVSIYKNSLRLIEDTMKLAVISMKCMKVFSGIEE